jgi:two-component system sensor histidine kinase CpxA
LRIFLRNFLTFWIATVIIIVITGIVISRSRNRIKGPQQPLLLPELRACVQADIRDLERASLEHAAKTLGPSRCGIIFIEDKSRPGRFGDAASEDIRSLVNGVTPQAPVNLQLIPGKTLVAFDVPGNSAELVAVAVLLVAVIVSTFSCLALTRHFVSPIRQLQRVTDSFGRGNLDERPDASLLNRKDELGDLSKTIAEMSDRISTLMTFQKRFLVQVSHELGSPLTRLKIALALACRKVTPALLPELDQIQRESSELNSMIQQLLKLGRLESGLEEEDQETYSLNQVLEEVCADAQFIAEEMGKHVHCSASQPIAVRGHRELLKRALDNILRNAIRYSPNGGYVNVEVARKPNNVCVILVKDAGAGVAEEKLEAIFEPFVRVSSGDNRAGVGLGLAIAKQGVLANGGTIRALNLEQGGLMIEVRLPSVPNYVAVATADGVTAVQGSSE